MSDLNDFDDLRIVPRPLAIKIVGVSDRNWERMESRGETPPKTQLSPHRIGYRVRDLREWLDARRQTVAS